MEPKPPRELDVEPLCELELVDVDVDVVPLRLEVSAVETAVGARLENSGRERLVDE